MLSGGYEPLYPGNQEAPVRRTEQEYGRIQI